jgi:signal transduction histidine kinase
VQEGLNNVHKHALASQVQVRLKHTSPRALMVSISDDGRGLPDDFDLSALPNQGRYGLLGISERVALMGGRLKFQNQAQGGLLLQAEIPHPRVASGEERQQSPERSGRGGARDEGQGAA